MCHLEHFNLTNLWAGDAIISHELPALLFHSIFHRNSDVVRLLSNYGRAIRSWKAEKKKRKKAQQVNKEYGMGEWVGG